MAGDFSSSYLDFGAIDLLAGLGELTIVAKVQSDANLAKATIFSNWETTSGYTGHAMLRVDSGQCQVFIGTPDAPTGGSVGRTVPAASGTWQNVGLDWDGATLRGYTDGVVGGTTYAFSGSLQSAASALYWIGNSPHASPNYWYGRIAELAIIPRSIGPAGHAAYARGISPLLLGPHPIFYAPLLRRRDDIIGAHTPTVNGTVAEADHPRIILPSRRRLIVKPATGGGTTVSVAVTGVSATGSVGDPSVSLDSTAALTGVSGSGAVGTVNVSAGANKTVALDGVSATGSVGTLSLAADASPALTGVAGTGHAGTLSLATSSEIAVTGVSATGQVGSVTITGAVAEIWTAVSPASGTWSAIPKASGTWTAA